MQENLYIIKRKIINCSNKIRINITAYQYCVKISNVKSKQLQWQVFTRMIDGSFAIVIYSDHPRILKNIINNDHRKLYKVNIYICE